MRIVLPVLLMTGACAATPDPTTLDGHLYEYVRSNRDGSLPETILVYLPSASQVEVVKIVEPCTDAAYVTAVVDPETGSASRLVAGRLERDGGQRVIGAMQYDAVRRRIKYELGPGGEVRGSLEEVSPRWHLYDYDFATLVSDAHYRWPLGGSTAFDLVRLMPTAEGPLSFEKLGAVELHPGPSGAAEMEYRVAGTGLPDGRLTRRIADGAVLDISSGERNHLEYEDFALRLVTDRVLSSEDWDARRAAHWEHCED